MIVDKLEDTLKGGYNGLYSEVVTEDTYELKKISWQPDLIFDIGGNVGVFTRFARTLFPNALIITVEPDPENFTHLKKFTHDDNVIFINKALGKGTIWHATTAVNGSGECYLSEGLGYPSNELESASNLEKSNVETIMLDEIINTYLKSGMKSILKLDCEGAENSIWEDEKSMEAFRKIDYVAAEIHWYALHGRELIKVKEITNKALDSFKQTHDCRLEHIHFYAIKK